MSDIDFVSAALKTSTSRSSGRGVLQTAASELLRRTLYPLMKWREYPQCFALLREFRQYEFASSEIILAHQTAALRKLLRHAAAHVPYYGELFDRSGIDPAELRLPDDLSAIPPLSKSALRERQGDLLATNVERSKLRWNASGGSTGEPVQFCQDERYWASGCAIRWFFESWWGIQPGEPTAAVWGADRDFHGWDWKERLYSRISQLKVCNAFALTRDRMEKFARTLNAWQPPLITGYASALETFAHFLFEQRQWRIRPRAVISSAEILTEEQRVVIESAFDAPVYNFYGSREVNNLAAECPACCGLHTNMLTRYLEIVDDEGKPLPAGTPGRVLVTDLVNTAMPFIRYENGDIASWAEQPCKCGRPFRLLEKIWGRSSDFIVTPDGKSIHGEFFTHLFYYIREVQTFQVMQHALREVEVSVVLRPGVQDFDSKALLEQMAEALGPEVHCAIRTVESIPKLATGKRRFTVSAVPASWRGSGGAATAQR
jgi:phenylacetate-CoA ligase